MLVGMTPLGVRADVRGLSVRRRQPADPRLELRVRRPGGRLRPVRAAASRRPAAGRAADRPADPARRRSRTPSTRCARGATPARSSSPTTRAAWQPGRVRAQSVRRSCPVREALGSRSRTRSARACGIVPALTAASRSALTAARTAAVTVS